MFRFDFAISYAGEDEGIASDLCQFLREKGATVFFAANEKVYLLGKGLYSELPYVFGPYTRFAIPIVSMNYHQKYWPLREFEYCRKEQKKRGFEFILPLRLDDIELPGLKEDLVYLDVRREGILKVCEIMMGKLTQCYPDRAAPVPTQWVATFGVNIQGLLEADALPDAAPPDYPSLCDWLEEDLIGRIREIGLERAEILEDCRTGETFSVRLGFRWNPADRNLQIGELGWWELLELNDWASVYSPENRRF
jgi:hypothetical protein